jgi:hypothetical protein
MKFAYSVTGLILKQLRKLLMFLTDLWSALRCALTHLKLEHLAGHLAAA